VWIGFFKSGWGSSTKRPPRDGLGPSLDSRTHSPEVGSKRALALGFKRAGDVRSNSG
jgi:hypothetical protein